MITFNPETIRPEERENIKTWIKELRSGNHQQGRGALCLESGKTCCLGVYALTGGKADKGNTVVGSFGAVYMLHFPGSLSAVHLLPSTIWEYDFPALSEAYSQDQFAAWNDSGVVSFEKIAFILDEFLAGRQYVDMTEITNSWETLP